MCVFQKACILCLVYVLAVGAINVAFSDDIAKVAEQVRKRAEAVSDEAATKMVFCKKSGQLTFSPS